MDENELSGKVIGAAVEVRRHLGPGLLEGVYRDCLAHELRVQNLSVERDVGLPVRYKEIEFDTAYRADLIVARSLIVELKAVDKLLPLHTAQLLSYLRLSRLKIGLLINFNTAKLVDGVKRVVNNL
jgi:GxxExxY protein